MAKPAKKNPSSIIYWNDLENDEQLRTCSLAAKGLWDHHMLPIAARSNEPGVILLGNHASRLDDDLPGLLARAVGESADVIARLLRELIDSGAASVDDAGRVYNRRMVREEEARQQKIAAGRKGGLAPKTRKQTPEQNGSGDGSDAGSGEESGSLSLTIQTVTTIPNEPEAQPEQTPKQNGSETEASSFLQDPQGLPIPVETTEGLSGSEPILEHGEPASDDLAPPVFLKRAPVSRSQPIPQDWEPSAMAKANLRRSRPDITPEILDLRMVEFRAWLLENNRQTFNPDATWLGFMVKTRVQPDRSQSRPTDRGAPTVADGITAAFARRSVPAGG